MYEKKLHIAVVGLRFGGEFPAIYREHPDVGLVSICDKDSQLLDAFGNRFGFERRHTDFDSLLLDDSIDAIHIITPIHTHEELAVMTLKAGKHCACTVPMSTTIEGLRAIISAQKESGKNYMMMETSVYTYWCLYAKELIDRGELGGIQYLRGFHFQDMQGWPDYWNGLPPMHYATHAVAPLLYLSGSRAAKVHAFGTGRLPEGYEDNYKNPFSVETAIFQLEKDNMTADVSRSLFCTAREYVEGFTIYGEKKSIEWSMEDEEPYLFEFLPSVKAKYGQEIKTGRIPLIDYASRLPEPIRKFTREHTILDPLNPHQSIKQGGGHHGSHPHLVHEFVRSIVEERKPTIDAIVSANWTAPGISAHLSAILNGAEVEIPSFE